MKIILKTLRRSSFLLSIFLFSFGQVLAQADHGMLQLADSIAKETLEKEGLFTVFGGLKPISTVEHFKFPIDTVTKVLLEVDVAATQIQLLQESLEELSNENIGFAIIPFKAISGEERIFQLLVYNKASLQNTIEKYADFFLKRGIVAASDPQAILVMYEFEEIMDRFRAYGYLFGYPQHAVDFFVEAAIHKENTGEFVKRSFFQIPVASSETGRFVYALPENQEPLTIDMELKQKAGEVLETYKRIRDEFLKDNKGYSFLELFQFIRDNFAECRCIEEKSLKFSK